MELRPNIHIAIFMCSVTKPSEREYPCSDDSKSAAGSIRFSPSEEFTNGFTEETNNTETRADQQMTNESSGIAPRGRHLRHGGGGGGGGRRFWSATPRSEFLSAEIVASDCGGQISHVVSGP